MISTGVSQAIPVLVSPFLSRLFKPEEFGVMALVLTVAAALSVLATGRLELAVVMPDTDKEAAKVMRLGIEFSFWVSIVFGVIFIVAQNNALFFIKVPPPFKPYYIWLGPAIFIYAVYQLISYWLLRKNAYWASAINKISQTSSTTAINVIVGLFKFNAGLIFSELVGRLLGSVIGFYHSIKSGFNWPRFQKAERSELMKRYRKFIYFASFPAFLDSLSLNLPVLFLTTWYSVETTGYFQLSRMVLTIPIALISAAFSQVLLRKTIELKSEQKPLARWYLRIALVLTVCFLPFFMILTTSGVELFQLIFGEEWGKSGLFAAILAGSYYMRFVIAPLSSVFPALEKVKISGGWQIFYSLLIGSLVFLKGLDVKHFLYVLLIAEIIAYSVYLILIIQTIRRFDNALPA
jgi:O-antigen/teichoic acid export membrane protein